MNLDDLSKDDLTKLIQAAEVLLEKQEVSSIKKKNKDDNEKIYQPLNKRKKLHKSQGKKDPILARREPIIIQNRKNRFEEMIDKKTGIKTTNEHKDDVAIDKLLIGDRKPTPRVRSTEYLEVKCEVCEKIDRIHSDMMSEYSDYYKCNNCTTLTIENE